MLLTYVNIFIDILIVLLGCFTIVGLILYAMVVISGYIIALFYRQKDYDEFIYKKYMKKRTKL